MVRLACILALCAGPAFADLLPEGQDRREIPFAVVDGKPITITDPTMTRFMMTLTDAVDLVLYAFSNGNNGDIYVQKSPAATVEVLARSILELMDKKDHPIDVMGSRHGEKLYESLLSREERACAVDMGEYFRVPPDGRDLNYAKFVDVGEDRITQALHGEEYNSQNTQRLEIDSMKRLLLKLEFMQKIARGETAVAED